MDSFNSFLVTIRPVTELLYFVASIGMACFAYFGLQQIAILKSTATTQANRDALRLTSEQCAIYMEKIIPLQNDFDRHIKDQEIKWFEGWTTEIDGQKIRVHRSTPQDMYNLSTLGSHIGHFNQMEAFSVYFVSRLADEKGAYHTIGRTFVSHMDKVIPFVVSAREDGYYKNMVSLYVIWKARAEVEKLSVEQKKLESKLSSFRSASATASPIGSEIR